MTSNSTRAKHAILGALVADAASLGMHWLYSQKRIHEIAPQNPEFHTPDPADYAGNVGYFAHAGKQAGELSHYGQQALVMLDALAKNNGRYDKSVYEQAFRDYFGYGGSYCGYIDRPTRDTLDTLYRNEFEALARANSIEFNGNPAHQQSLLIKILAAAKRDKGDQLKQTALQYVDAITDADDMDTLRNYALALTHALGGGADYPGAQDEQLPAVSKLPALVACYATSPELGPVSVSAIKVTNNTPVALDYGTVCTELLRATITGDDMHQAINAGVGAASPQTREFLADVLSREGSLLEITKQVGMACNLKSGVPSLLYNLKTAPSFVEAVRSNIYAGGDNCGRSIVLGAATGAQFGIGGEHGIPAEWLEKLVDRQRIETLLDALLP